MKSMIEQYNDLYPRLYAGDIEECFRLRISANVTADFGNVTGSARSGVARC